MFKGNYSFFDYKYNIVGYIGQDFGGFPQYLYVAISIILLIVLLIIFRKSSKEKVLKMIRIVSIFMILFYLFKTIWETIYDIKFSGSFNTGLLPFDTCSIIMIAGLISGFGKGKIKEISDAWLATGGVVGGISALVTLSAFNYYPFFSFGAFYSMIWHFLMLFLGLLLIVTNYVEPKYKTILYGFLFQLVVSIIIIPIDFIYNWDFMLYLNLGGVPFFEDIASKFTAMNLPFLNPIMMLVLYFVAFHIAFLVPLGIKKIIAKVKKV